MDASDILLLVQEDKQHLDGSDPEPQLIAEAIAALYNTTASCAHEFSMNMPSRARSYLVSCIILSCYEAFEQFL